MMQFLQSPKFTSFIIGAIIALFGFVLGLYTQAIKTQIQCDTRQESHLLTKTVICKITHKE